MANIELLMNIPVDKKYGLTKGKVVEIYKELEPKYKIRASPSVSVLIGSVEIALFDREYKRLAKQS